MEKTTGTKEQVIAIEESQIKKFNEELEAVCEKYSVIGIFCGTRPQTANFDDHKSQSMCCAFAMTHLDNGGIQELKGVLEAYSQAEDIAEKIAHKIGKLALKNMLQEIEEEKKPDIS